MGFSEEGIEARRGASRIDSPPWLALELLDEQDGHRGAPPAGWWGCAPACVGEARPAPHTRPRSRRHAGTGNLTVEHCNELMAAVANGDRKAFATLFRHYAPRIKGYLVRSGTPEAVADDLSQDAMVLLWRCAASFDPARGSLSTWIFTVARNLRVDHHRRSVAGGAGLVFTDLDLLDAQPGGADLHAGPDDALQAAQRQRSVRRALAKLTKPQALLLHLWFFEERPQASIARELGIPLASVRSRIRAALSCVRKHLDVN